MLERAVFDLVPGELVSLALILNTLVKRGSKKSDNSLAVHSLLQRIRRLQVKPLAWRLSIH
jgi:hypothetical protein